MSGRVDWLTSKQVICTVGNNGESVGTDALVCPPIYPYVSSRQATSSPFEGLGEAFAGCVLADRRGRLSLQIPYFSNRANNLFTRQLPTHQLYLITILNCEL